MTCISNEDLDRIIGLHLSPVLTEVNGIKKSVNKVETHLRQQNGRIDKVEKAIGDHITGQKENCPYGLTLRRIEDKLNADEAVAERLADIALEKKALEGQRYRLLAVLISVIGVVGIALQLLLR
jgi:predicted  nucleic acid-binding Zn-ribbon protein